MKAGRPSDSQKKSLGKHQLCSFQKLKALNNREMQLCREAGFYPGLASPLPGRQDSTLLPGRRCRRWCLAVTQGQNGHPKIPPLFCKPGWNPGATTCSRLADALPGIELRIHGRRDPQRRCLSVFGNGEQEGQAGSAELPSLEGLTKKIKRR